MTSTSAEAPSQQPKGTRRRRRLVIVVVAVTALVLAAYGWNWRTHPSAFGGYGNALRAPVAVGRPLHVAMTWSRIPVEPRTVTLHAAAARVTENTADAEISFALCRFKGDGFGAADGALERWCDVLPVDGGELMLDARDLEAVVMTVRPTRPGVVRVRGVDVTYSDGWQRGSQHTGSRVIVRTR